MPGAEAAVSGDQDFIYRRSEKFTDRALFGELTWHVTDRIHLTGGLRCVRQRFAERDADRHSALHVALESDRTPSSTPKRTTRCQGQPRDRHQGRRPRLPDVLRRLSPRRLERRAARRILRGGSALADLRRRHGHELRDSGSRAGLAGLRYDLSVFQVDWDDPQLNTATPNWGFFVVQNGERGGIVRRRAAACGRRRRQHDLRLRLGVRGCEDDGGLRIADRYADPGRRHDAAGRAGEHDQRRRSTGDMPRSATWSSSRTWTASTSRKRGTR